jgi:hypothetical protein
MDIFETLKSMLGCLYISDLKFGPYRELAIEMLKEIATDSKQMADVCNYLGMGGI